MAVVPTDDPNLPTYPEYEFSPPRPKSKNIKFDKKRGLLQSAHEDVSLYYEVFYPEGDDLSVQKPVIIFYHGIQEHFARYCHVIERFATLGYRVAAMDMRGHGLSTGKRAYTTRFSYLVDDAQRFIEQKVLTAEGMNPSKLLLWGQSYGGLLAPHVYLRMKPQLATDTLGGLLLTSCAVGVDKTLIMKLQTPLGPCVSALLPKLALTPAVSPSMMSSDPEAVKNYANDPLNTRGNLAARLAWETELAFRALKKQSAQVTCPLYVTHGSKDVCTSRKESKAFFEAVSSQDKVYVDTSLYHTMLHEPERETIIESMEEWLKERM
ncbi:hypothetical protein TrST_g8022 [Triparma strigata]|uniref:Serine aminopeptidase S33 domain-containing protein n=1 Tax=Triparma strigata TaxID=1606541 RepID=A0A9W7EJD3_9STRA|nr:hypothetical protein TrST_g8022 [Triparma strigata]